MSKKKLGAEKATKKSPIIDKVGVQMSLEEVDNLLEQHNIADRYGNEKWRDATYWEALGILETLEAVGAISPQLEDRLEMKFYTPGHSWNL